VRPAPEVVLSCLRAVVVPGSTQVLENGSKLFGRGATEGCVKLNIAAAFLT